MKFTPSVVIDAPGYYVDHCSGGKNTDKCIILRDKQLESDSESMPVSLKHLSKPTNILDLTNNELKELPNLRNRTDIHTLLLGRNDIKYVNGKGLPRHLRNLVLANNNISSISQLKGLHYAPKTLTNLSLRGNPICHLQDFRIHVIRYIPKLQVLDFQNVTKEERRLANSKIENRGDMVKDQLQKVSVSKNRERKDKNIELMNFVIGKMSEERKKELKQQLSNAKSLDEIMKLEKLLSGS